MNNLNYLVFENFSKAFSEKLILKDINLSLQSGKINGLVAPNGSGKTTLMKCIVNLYDFAGSITYNGESVGSHFNKKIIYSPAIPYFENLDFSVSQYLDLMITLKELDYKTVMNSFKETSLFELRNNICKSLSTGQKKAFQLFIDFQSDPDVIIMDEPMNGLDYEYKKIVIFFIKFFAKKNKIILISTHIFSDLEGLVDSVLFLKDYSIKVHSVSAESNKEIEEIYLSYFSENEENKLKEKNF